jgi:PLP dependent protein
LATIAENIRTLKRQIPGSVKIVAVSKTRSVDDILEVYNSGHRIFGENRVRELLGKKDKLPSDIEWHLVGHLQSNKVKYIVPFVNMIQSIDSHRLLSVVSREADRCGRVMPCLLQIHIAEEETKFGFSMDELREIINNRGFNDLKNIRICGVMGMATFTDNQETIRREFKLLADYFRELKHNYFAESKDFNDISMGMSGDFKLAIEEGSTIIRIGTLIFGERK